MPSSATRLTRLGATAMLASGLLLAAGPAFATEPAECEVAVAPRVGEAGTVFTLSGEGYTPTQLVLRKDGGRETAVELELDGADPFEIPIGSRTGDEGVWRATVAVADSECSATVTFRVTLLDTSTLSEGGGRGGGGLPLFVFALAAAAAFAGGTLLARSWRLA